MDMKRKAELIPKTLQIRFGDNTLSICYSIQDDVTKAIMGETYVNFTPSKKLMKLLSGETTKAIQSKDD